MNVWYGNFIIDLNVFCNYIVVFMGVDMFNYGIYNNVISNIILLSDFVFF